MFWEVYILTLLEEAIWFWVEMRSMIEKKTSQLGVKPSPQATSIDLYFLLFIFITAGLRSGLPTDWAHWGKQVQHLRVGRVAPQKQAHVHRDDGQWQDHQRQEGRAEENQLPLPAADGAATVIGQRWRWWLRGESNLDDALTEGQGQKWKTHGMTCGHFTKSRWTKDISIFKKKEIRYIAIQCIYYFQS